MWAHLCYVVYIGNKRSGNMRRQVANGRINMRTNPQTKYYLELAAFLGGFNSLTNFLLDAAESRAESILEEFEAEGQVLSDRDREQILKMLSNAPEPNDRLKKLIASVSEVYKTEDGKEYQQVDDSLFKRPTA